MGRRIGIHRPFGCSAWFVCSNAASVIVGELATAQDGFEKIWLKNVGTSSATILPNLNGGERFINVYRVMDGDCNIRSFVVV